MTRGGVKAFFKNTGFNILRALGTVTVLPMAGFWIARAVKVNSKPASVPIPDTFSNNRPAPLGCTYKQYKKGDSIQGQLVLFDKSKLQELFLKHERLKSQDLPPVGLTVNNFFINGPHPSDFPKEMIWGTGGTDRNGFFIITIEAIEIPLLDCEEYIFAVECKQPEGQ